MVYSTLRFIFFKGTNLGHKKTGEKTSKSISSVSTVEREYFQYLEAFLRLIEPIIHDLRVKGFIK